MTDVVNAFVLTREWHDSGDGVELVFWAASERGPLRIVVTGQEPVCFVRRDAVIEPRALRSARANRRPLALATFDRRPVDGLYFRAQRDLARFRDGPARPATGLHEADLKPSDRYLMERFVTGGVAVRGTVAEGPGYLEARNPAVRPAGHRPRLTALALDIETDPREQEILSAAVSGDGGERVFMRGPAPAGLPGVPVEYVADEPSVLTALMDWIADRDPDLILGWNVVAFDLEQIERRCRALGIPFALGRGGDRATVLRPENGGQTTVARIPGRVALDGIETLRSAFWQFESFALEAVARDLLGRGKLIAGERDKVAEIRRLFDEDKPALAAYNLEDCRLVLEIFARADLVSFAVERSRLTGLALGRQGGSVAAFDNLYLPRLHRRGYVAPDPPAMDGGARSPGGYVLDSKPGLYDNVIVLDFKSLYPSIIRTFLIDPLGMAEAGEDAVPGFEEASFSRDDPILPALIGDLWAVRDRAKADGDGPLSQAVKIIMNSFYGVLGSSGCRFHDPRLASSITRRGHEIIRTTRDLIEARGHRVIYGDTDSLFVLLGSGTGEPEAREVGTRLATELNDWWRREVEQRFRLRSFLELQFETHYLRFLMPTLRGAETGTKKRYAGLVRGPEGERELVFKGLESVRTDWTPLARRFQRELYRRVFLGEPFTDFVRGTVAELRAGRLDEELVYRKRIRRGLHEYVRNVPPHVQAARKQRRPGRWVSYVVTRSGPEPVENRDAKPDYDHYCERQLMPAADGILHFLDTSFSALTDSQLEIF